jgi:hypothetical protein
MLKILGHSGRHFSTDPNLQSLKLKANGVEQSLLSQDLHKTEAYAHFDS